MTWKKTKVMRLLREGKNWPTVLFMRPYNEKNHKAVGLPPGWQRMCKAVGLRPNVPRRRSAKDWLHLKGAGRLWRVNGRAEFDASCRYADFDKWGNNKVKTFPLPKNKTELELYVRFTTYDT